MNEDDWADLKEQIRKHGRHVIAECKCAQCGSTEFAIVPPDRTVDCCECCACGESALQEIIPGINFDVKTWEHALQI